MGWWFLASLENVYFVSGVVIAIEEAKIFL
jgi:hypothetical protein